MKKVHNNMETQTRRGRTLGDETYKKMVKTKFLAELFKKRVFKVSDLLKQFNTSRMVVNLWFDSDNIKLNYLLAICDVYDLTLCVNFVKNTPYGSTEFVAYYVGDPIACKAYIEEAEAEAKNAPEGKRITVKTYEAALADRKQAFCRDILNMRGDIRQDKDIMEAMGITRMTLNALQRNCAFSTDNLYKFFDVEGGSLKIFFEGYMPE